LPAPDDVTSATKAAVETGRSNAKKVSLSGHSFGGHEIQFIITKSDRFTAAVSGASIADLTRFYLSVVFL